MTRGAVISRLGGNGGDLEMSNSSSPESSQTCLDLPEEEKENEGARHVLSLANLRVLEPNDQIRELQTIVRDRCAMSLFIGVGAGRAAQPVSISTICHLK